MDCLISCLDTERSWNYQMIAQPHNRSLKHHFSLFHDKNKPHSYLDLENKLILPAQHLTKVKTFIWDTASVSVDGEKFAY